MVLVTQAAHRLGHLTQTWHLSWRSTVSDGSFPQMDRILRGAAEEKNVPKQRKEHDIQGQRGRMALGAERSSLCEMIVWQEQR